MISQFIPNHLFSILQIFLNDQFAVINLKGLELVSVIAQQWINKFKGDSMKYLSILLLLATTNLMAQQVEVCTAIGIPDSNIILAALQSDILKNDLQASYDIKNIELQKVSGCHTYLVTLKNSEGNQTSLEVKFNNASFSYEVKKYVAQNSSPKTLSEVYSTIDQLNQDLKCNSDSDCTPVALGKRACGGPSKYIVASNLNIEIGRIRSLAKRSEILEDEENQSNGGFGICSFEMAPQAKCRQQKCGK